MVSESFAKRIIQVEVFEEKSASQIKPRDTKGYQEAQWCSKAICGV